MPFVPANPPHEFWKTNEADELCRTFDSDSTFRNEVNTLRHELAYFYDDEPIDWAYAAMRIAWESREMLKGFHATRNLGGRHGD